MDDWKEYICCNCFKSKPRSKVVHFGEPVDGEKDEEVLWICDSCNKKLQRVINEAKLRERGLS